MSRGRRGCVKTTDLYHPTGSYHPTDHVQDPAYAEERLCQLPALDGCSVRLAYILLFCSSEITGELCPFRRLSDDVVVEADCRRALLDTS